MAWFLLALLLAPAVAWGVYRLARALGFLEPPASKEQEYRRTIVVALYALLLFLPLFVYGAEKRWPRIWIVFGFVNGLVLVVISTLAVWSAARLWRLRHPAGPPVEDSAAAGADRPAARLDAGGDGSPPV
jgi:hypothetical protein